MLPFRVIVKPQHRLVPSATPPCPSPFSLTLTQPLSFQTFTHSSAQRATSIYFSFNHFRTLSLATEGVPPFFPFWNSSPSLSLPHYAPYFQSLMYCKFRKPFIFRFIHVMGGVPPNLPAHRRANVRRYPQSLHHYLLTSLIRQSPHPSHCSQRPLVPQLAKSRESFTIRGNKSAPPGV